ncbi:MAG: hypothetical protein JWM79_4007 [Nocardioides sp.]|nr:hypothetical protein [Nocardioides sp.]
MTPWALALGIVGSVTGIGSLVVSFLNYRASGPRIKVSVSSFYLIGPRGGGVLTVEAVNRGRVPATIRQVRLRSVNTSATIWFDPACDQGPALPLSLAPTESRTWVFFDDDTRRRLSGNHPGECHDFRGHVVTAGRELKSRSRKSFATEMGVNHSTRRERLREFERSLLHAQVQDDGAATTPELLGLGLQRVTFTNYMRSPAFNFRVDCTISNDQAGTSRVAGEIPEQEVRLILPRTKKHVWLPVDLPTMAEGESAMWRYRWRTLGGAKMTSWSGIIDRAIYEDAAKAGHDLVAPGLAGSGHPILRGERIPRRLRSG